MNFVLPLAPLVCMLLGALRVGVVLVMLPVVGGNGVPSPVRVLLSFGLALALTGVPAGAMPATASALVLAAGRELLLGLVLGFLCQVLLSAPALAGELVAQELGLKMAEDVDPTTRLPMSAVSRVYETSLLLLFLVAQGHHDVLRALHESFARFPVGDSSLPTNMAALAGSAGTCLRFAVQIAAPLFAVLLCGSLALALLTRAVPELHVMTFGYPLRLLASMAAAVLLFPFVAQPGLRLIAGLQRALVTAAGADVAEDLFDTQERTEEPTARRLEEARGQGRFARSDDLAHALVLLSVAGFLVFAGGGVAQVLRTEIVEGVRRLARPPENLEQAIALVRDTLVRLARIAGPCVLIAGVAAFALHFLQAGGFFVVRDAFRMRFDKFDVARNFSRMFGLKSWVKVLAGVLKFAVILGVIAWGTRARLDRFTQLSGMDFDRTVPAVVNLLLAMFVQVTGVLVVLGAADWAFQRWQHHREMRMSKQQVRDESKHEDGDPQMRKRIRDRQRAIVERPLRQTVPEATVIVTNPTHYSVAIRYEEGKSAAPVVTAKGVDRVAEEIKRLAREHDVPILEQPPLARALFRDVPVGQMVPEKLYRAVASVLAVVWRLKQKREAARAASFARGAGR